MYEFSQTRKHILYIFLNNSYQVPFFTPFSINTWFFWNALLEFGKKKKKWLRKGQYSNVKAKLTINVLVFSLLSFWGPNEYKISAFPVAAWGGKRACHLLSICSRSWRNVSVISKAVESALTLFHIHDLHSSLLDH